MSDIIDLTERRAAKDRPDADCVKQDDFGRDMQLYILSYEYEGMWSVEIWAYSMEDAQARVALMKQTLTLCGQVYGVIPA